MKLSRRQLLAHTVKAGAALALTPSASPAFSTQATGSDALTCLINGQALSRGQVLAWEARRLTIVWDKLRPHAKVPIRSELDALRLASASLPSSPRIDQWRADLLALKLQLGPQRLKEILATELALSNAVAQLMLGTSFGRYTLAVTDVQCHRGSAAGFVKWFADRVHANDEAAMLLACPDHYVIETQADGRQYVLETTGGSPLASQFDIDYTNASGNPVALAPELPVRVGGMAMALGSKRVIGCAFHQFGELPGGGFRGRLSVAFPWSTPWFMIDGHRWHLACEFSNWIEAYLRTEA